MTGIGQIVRNKGMKPLFPFGVIAGIFLWMAISCSNQEIVIQKKSVFKMSVYPDSSFVGDIKALQFHDSLLYFLDINRRSLLMMDRNLSALHSVSRGGRAQEELLDPFSFTVSGDSVFIIDFGGFKMKSFHNGVFVEEKTVPVNTRDQRFVKDGNTFFLPIRDAEASVVKTTLTNLPITLLQTEKFFSPMKTVTMNACHILSYRQNLIIVPEALPWVKIISEDGEVVRTIDLTHSALYSRNISFAQKADRDEKGFYVLNSDICIAGDVLLILIPTYGERYTCNRIVSVSLSSGEMMETVMSLPGIVYSNFCSDGKLIYAFNSSENQIEVYEM